MTTPEPITADAAADARDATAETTARAARRSGAKRQRLIDIGTELFTQKGFSSTGLDEIVLAAAVPKGSFYYYFGSKDAFAHAVIDNYAHYFARKLDRTLGNAALSPLQRLKAFTQDATLGMQRFDFRRGCLVGNLGQELGGLEEHFRQRLLGVLDGWRERVRHCIAQAQASGEIGTPLDAALLAQFFWSAWEGAVLCAKLERSTRALDNVSSLFLDHLLLPAPAATPQP
jgi:TetR/AcrR family transcriptional regulator, transcriptional repressor for nem operon